MGAAIFFTLVYEEKPSLCISVFVAFLFRQRWKMYGPLWLSTWALAVQESLEENFKSILVTFFSPI